MRRECMQAVAQALGRELNQVESRDIEARITRAARSLAQADPAAWSSKPQAQKLAESGTRAAQELIGEARLKAEREALQMAAIARYGKYKFDAERAGVSGFDALNRKIAFHSDGKVPGTSIESNAKAVRNDLLRQLIPVLEASNPKWFGLLENREGVHDLMRGLFKETTQTPEAKLGGKVWGEVATAARNRMNAAGGDIGTLEDWNLPHHHSQVRVSRAGREEWLKTLPLKERASAKLRGRNPPPNWARDRWVADILPGLNRRKYVKEDGAVMSDTELTEFLREAWLTIATGGANKLEPGKYSGGGMRANRGNQSRQIHFKDAQSFIDYQTKYGERSLYEVLVGHIEGIAKDIALVEELGPNPDAAFRLHKDQAYSEAAKADPGDLGKFKEAAIKAENLYNVVAGKSLPVANERTAAAFDSLRNWLAASKLGGAVVSSITDEGTLHLTARLNKLPALQVFANELAALNPANKMEERLANRAGLALNTLLSSINRFGDDSLKGTFSRKAANTVMRAQGLNALTEARRRAFGVTMMDAMGSVVNDHAKLADLSPDDHRMLLQKGVTERDFQLWKAAKGEDWGGVNKHVLTPESVYRLDDKAVDRVIGPEIQKLKDKAQEHIDDLKKRDVEDRGWVAARASKLTTWLAKAKSQMEKRTGKAEAGAKAEMDGLAKRIGLLKEDIDALAEGWKKPNGDMPGVDARRTVGFYGKQALREKGIDEGVARERVRSANREITAIARELKASKLTELEGLFEKFHERRADFDEFTKGSNERIARRQKVVDRITRELDPAIARARTGAREQAVTKLLASVLEESDMAVIEPGARERAVMGAGSQRGTPKGELSRSFWQFKGFPLSMIMRHWSRAFAQPTKGGQAKYLAALIASTTVLGAMAMQVKEVLAGRDPRNLNPFAEHGVKNWIKAMLQGGSIGLYGDFLFSDKTQRGTDLLASFLGPVAGLAADGISLSVGNIHEAGQGQDTHAGAEAVRFVQGNLPGGNLWYTKAGLDHLIWQNLAEYVSPGYLRRMERRAQRDFGQSFWWAPGEVLPERAPDVTAIAGEED